ncbi:MAG: PEP-CTERM sorting domain-containing protein [Zymomonas sp.]|nr:MAG: PEP-CTERM sorting domain-containing protein [Zymomonas sp.]
MRNVFLSAVAGAALSLSQPAAAAVVTLAFTGTIGPITTPARLSGGAFDGSIRFDDTVPFATSPGLLIVRDGPLANSYQFGATPGAFLPASYRTTFNDSTFTFQGTSDEGASLTFNLLGNVNTGFSGTFSFAQGSDFAATGTATIAGASAVPEPASWTILIAGFGLVGVASRKGKGVRGREEARVVVA